MPLKAKKDIEGCKGKSQYGPLTSLPTNTHKHPLLDEGTFRQESQLLHLGNAFGPVSSQFDTFQVTSMNLSVAQVPVHYALPDMNTKAISIGN